MMGIAKMYKLICHTLIAASLSALLCSSAFALDARTAALGGSAIANAKGVHGALENPSALMRMQRDQQIFHIHFGISTDIQDSAALIQTAIDEETLPEDVEREIDILTGRVLTCDETSSPETVCLSDTRTLGELSTRVLDILNQADGQPINAMLAADFGIAYSKWSIPIALHYKQSVTGAGKSIIAQEDRDYVGTFATVLADDELTFDELFSAVPLTISEDGQSLSVLQPEDALESDVAGSFMVREQLGLSMATSVTVAGINVDVGITPKFSELTASSLTTELNDRFNDDSDTFATQFEENENTATTWNIDLGASANLTDAPITVSVVARNLIKETITTKENFEFETTPQLIVGGAYRLGRLTVSADVALNEAKLDNMETQITAVGVEMSNRFFGARAGISHDEARTNDATALSLGFSLGPLHVGGRLTAQKAAQAGAQLAFSF